MPNFMNLLLLGLLAAGHCELMVTFVNRIHALAMTHKRLHGLRRIHDILLPTVPLWMFYSLGMTGPKLLWGGSWYDVSLPWRIYLAVCSLGLLGLIWTALRWNFSRPTDLMVGISRQIDPAPPDSWESHIGPGPYQQLVRLPFNQQFSFEINEKQFRHPQLNNEGSEFSIWHLSDWHLQTTVRRQYFDRVIAKIKETPADLIVFSGDLLEHAECLDWIPQTLGELKAAHGCWFILGNHDWNLQFQGLPVDQIRQLLTGCGWQDLGSQCVSFRIGAQQIAMAGDETPWLGVQPLWEGVSLDAFRILVSHTPDHLANARRDGVHLMLAGHTHGGQVRLPGIGPVYSPSRHGCRYASGEFWKPPTLLHVSRGLSGQHPLRVRCRPEVTRLVLRGSAK